MLVMGIDPGSISFGIGILKKEGSRISYIHSEEVKLKEPDFNLKMKTLWHRLLDLYRQFPLESAAIEEGFTGKNPRSANLLAKVRGVVLASMISANIDLCSYSPSQVKQAITGNGNALKPQVAKVVKMLLNVNDKKMGADECDALAVAYCHCLSRKIIHIG